MGPDAAALRVLLLLMAFCTFRSHVGGDSNMRAYPVSEEPFSQENRIDDSSSSIGLGFPFDVSTTHRQLASGAAVRASRRVLIHLPSSVPRSSVEDFSKPPDEFEVLQALVLSRHGMRMPVKKHNFSQQEAVPRGDIWSDGGVTVWGQKQQDYLGQLLRQRYMPPTASGSSADENAKRKKFGDAEAAKKPDRQFLLEPPYRGVDGLELRDVFVQSSWTDRSMRSGMALLRALYPSKSSLHEEWMLVPAGETVDTSENIKTVEADVTLMEAAYSEDNVPIYTSGTKVDPVMRGWVSCGQFQKKVFDMKESDEFKTLSQKSGTLRASLAAQLKAVWVMVWKLRAQKVTQTSTKLLLSSPETAEYIRRFTSADLINFWNVFDYLLFMKLHPPFVLNAEGSIATSEEVQTNKQILRLLSKITEAEMKEAKKLVAALENLRYGSSFQDHYIGGLLARRVWRTVKHAMTAHTASNCPPCDVDTSIEDQKSCQGFDSEEVYYEHQLGFARKLQVYSGHYPTMIAVCGALGISVTAETPVGPSGPDTTTGRRGRDDSPTSKDELAQNSKPETSEKQTQRTPLLPNFGSAIVFEIVRSRVSDGESTNSKADVYLRPRYVEGYGGTYGLARHSHPPSQALLFDGDIWRKTACFEQPQCNAHVFVRTLQPILEPFSVTDWCRYCMQEPTWNPREMRGVAQTCTALSTTYLMPFSQMERLRLCLIYLVVGALCPVMVFVVIRVASIFIHAKKLRTASSDTTPHHAINDTEG